MNLSPYHQSFGRLSTGLQQELWDNFNSNIIYALGYERSFVLQQCIQQHKQHCTHIIETYKNKLQELKQYIQQTEQQQQQQIQLLINNVINRYIEHYTTQLQQQNDTIDQLNDRISDQNNTIDTLQSKNDSYVAKLAVQMSKHKKVCSMIKHIQQQLLTLKNIFKDIRKQCNNIVIVIGTMLNNFTVEHNKLVQQYNLLLQKSDEQGEKLIEHETYSAHQERKTGLAEARTAQAEMDIIKLEFKNVQLQEQCNKQATQILALQANNRTLTHQIQIQNQSMKAAQAKQQSYTAQPQYQYQPAYEYRTGTPQQPVYKKFKPSYIPPITRDHPVFHNNYTQATQPVVNNILINAVATSTTNVTATVHDTPIPPSNATQYMPQSTAPQSAPWTEPPQQQNRPNTTTTNPFNAMYKQISKIVSPFTGSNG